MIREIIKIDEALCDGCGLCIPACAEGALQIIDGKARLISDLFCDGLGACISECPRGAITIEKREAESYNEFVVMETIVKGGENVIKAHLKHLKDHKEYELLGQAVDYLNHHDISIPLLDNDLEEKQNSGSCPGKLEKTFIAKEENETGKRASQLTNWPIQMHLINPIATHFKNTDLLLAADCCAFSYGDFHKDYIKGKTLAIACPKLDSNKQVYLDKLISLINEANINSINVLIMEVPCCAGLYHLVEQAISQSKRSLPFEAKVISINGELIKSIKIN
ncbi:MAG: 4Fe-4S binding protein [Ignavibacteria bacterium]|nr:4Fe-4S binding protein [Ignavibacteria bacterium]